MALSNDQKALLRLLAQREQGYDDIAALMGLSVEEVRARVGDALAAVDRVDAAGAAHGGPDPADPGAPPMVPDAAPQPATPPGDSPAAGAAPATPPAGEATPPPPPRARAGAADSAAPRQSPRRPQLPRDRRLLALAAGMAAIVVLIVLLATGTIGGGSGGGGEGDGASGAGADRVAGLGPNVTGAMLQPLNGASGKGRAVFGREGRSAAMIVEAIGLQPSGPGRAYAVWLYKSPGKRIPLIFAKVDKTGRLLSQFKVPNEVLAYLAAGTFDQIAVSLGTNKRFAASLAAARKANRAPAYAGREVLRGKLTGPLTEIDLKKGK